MGVVLSFNLKTDSEALVWVRLVSTGIGCRAGGPDAAAARRRPGIGSPGNTPGFISVRVLPLFSRPEKPCRRCFFGWADARARAVYFNALGQL